MGRMAALAPRLLALLMVVVPVSAWAAHEPAAGDATKQIFLPPPIQWDSAMLNSQSALPQSGADLARLMGGLRFGMSPNEVNRRLPRPYPDMAWESMPLASEFTGDVRYFGVPLSELPGMRAGITACFGAGSYVVFLFTHNGLFRVSYRLSADKNCPETDQAAQQIFARYVPIDRTIALSERYRSGSTSVVDVTDPGVGSLARVRWRQERR